MLFPIVATVALLVGCKSSESPIFFSSPLSPYPDVPVPASFNLVSESTPAGMADNRRMIEHLYTSTDDVEPIVQYFSDQLPRKGWVRKGDSRNAGRSALIYSKGGDVLLIEVWKGVRLSTNVRIQISPAVSSAPG
jgi:hypothetical protein